MFLKQNAYDVVFLGSSRAETHFNPRIFDSITGTFSYNLGVTGATPRIAFAVLKAYCHTSKMPKHIVFDVDFHFLKYGIDTIRHFPRYFPFLSNPALLSEFNSIDARFNSFRYNPIHSLPFSNIRMLAASLHGWFGKVGKYDTTYYKGYAGVIFNEFPLVKTNKPFYGFIHPRERAYIDSIIGFSRRNHINLILVSSPMYKGAEVEMLNKTAVVNQIKYIARINGIEYWDMSKSAYSTNEAYFTDNFHMTAAGARLFSLGYAFNFKQFYLQKR